MTGQVTLAQFLDGRQELLVRLLGGYAAEQELVDALLAGSETDQRRIVTIDRNHRHAAEELMALVGRLNAVRPQARQPARGVKFAGAFYDYLLLVEKDEFLSGRSADPDDGDDLAGAHLELHGRRNALRTKATGDSRGMSIGFKRNHNLNCS